MGGLARWRSQRPYRDPTIHPQHLYLCRGAARAGKPVALWPSCLSLAISGWAGLLAGARSAPTGIPQFIPNTCTCVGALRGRASPLRFGLPASRSPYQDGRACSLALAAPLPGSHNSSPTPVPVQGRCEGGQARCALAFLPLTRHIRMGGLARWRSQRPYRDPTIHPQHLYLCRGAARAGKPVALWPSCLSLAIPGWAGLLAGARSAPTGIPQFIPNTCTCVGALRGRASPLRFGLPASHSPYQDGRACSLALAAPLPGSHNSSPTPVPV